MLRGGKLYTWEYGNEPDLYGVSSQGPVRPSNWNESTYVTQWLNGTREIKKLVEKYCPELGRPRFLGLSYATNIFDAERTWADGIDKHHDIETFSAHG